jgi:hypothetical protein
MKVLSRRGWRPAATLSISLVISLLFSLLAAVIEPPASAHGGGTPRLTSAPVGPYRLYAFTDPEPWRVGQTHVSLVVTKPTPDDNNNQLETPVTDVAITVTYVPMINNAVYTSSTPIVAVAQPQDFLGTFYYEAAPNVNRVGDWQINVDVSGPEGSGSQHFPMQTQSALALNWTLIGVGAAVFVVLLFLIALWSRSQKPVQPAHPPHRGVRRVQRQNGRTPERKEA